MSVDVPSFMEIGNNLPPTDLANIAFTKLFGENWWSIANRATDTFTGPFIPVLAVLNTALFSTICITSLITFLVSAFDTGAEGTVGGRNLNKFWWPLRTAMGISFSAPLTASGLSLLQVLILSATGYACSLGNVAWNASLEHFTKSNFIILTAQDPPQLRTEAKNLARICWDAAVTLRYKEWYLNNLHYDIMERGGLHNVLLPESMRWMHIEPWNYSSKSYTIKFTYINGQGIEYVNERMGTIEVQADDSGDPLANAKLQGIANMYTYFLDVALSCVNGKDAPDDFLLKGVSHFTIPVKKVLAGFNEYYPEYSSTRKTALIREKAREYGWMSAGAWPLSMSAISRDARDKAMATSSFMNMDYDWMIRQNDDLSYRSFTLFSLKMDEVYKNQPDPEVGGKTVLEAGARTDEWFTGRIMRYLGREALEGFVNSIETDGPVLAVTEYGQRMLDAAIATWGAASLAAAAQGGIDGAANSIWGKALGFVTGGGSGAAAGAASRGMGFLIDTAKMIVPLLAVLGGLLAFLFPALPWIYWAFACVAFIMLVLEMLVAAPFWAAAHAWSTQSTGFAGEMGKEGYFQLLDVVTRPVLLVAGFYIVFMLMTVAGELTTAMFGVFFTSYDTSEVSVGGPLTMLGHALVLALTFLGLMNYLCSESYSKLPRKVFRVLGVHAPTLSASDYGDQVKAAVLGAGFSGKGGGGSGPKGSGSGHAGGGASKPKPKPSKFSYHGAGEIPFSGGVSSGTKMRPRKK